MDDARERALEPMYRQSDSRGRCVASVNETTCTNRDAIKECLGIKRTMVVRLDDPADEAEAISIGRYIAKVISSGK